MAMINRERRLVLVAPYGMAFMFGPGAKDVYLRYAPKDTAQVLKWLHETTQAFEIEIGRYPVVQETAEIKQTPEVTVMVDNALASLKKFPGEKSVEGVSVSVEELGKFKIMGDEQPTSYHFSPDCDFRLSKIRIKGAANGAQCTSLKLDDHETLDAPCAFESDLVVEKWNLTSKSKVQISLNSGCELIELLGKKRVGEKSNCILISPAELGDL